MIRAARTPLFFSLTSASVFHAAEPTTARGTPSGVFVETEIVGVSARFIELASLGDLEIFADGFEGGDTSARSVTVP